MELEPYDSIDGMPDEQFRDYVVRRWNALPDNAYVHITQSIDGRKGEFAPHLESMDEIGCRLIAMHREYLVHMCGITRLPRSDRL